MSNKRRDVWRSLERHYCEVCNCWMGGDRQSIMLHENARRHQNNVEKKLRNAKIAKTQQERENEKLASTLYEIEKVAVLNHLTKDHKVYGRVAAAATATLVKPRQGSSYCGPRGFYAEVAGRSQPKNQDKDIKNNEFDTLKKKRDGVDVQRNKAMPNKALGINEGHYKIGNTTYLDCSVYVSILKVEMPGQIWKGESSIEGIKRAEKNMKQWKNGIIVKVKLVPKEIIGLQHETETLVDFAYLKNPNDNKETLEKNVKPSRIRLIVGSGDDVPNSVDEARLIILGGEEVLKIDETVTEIDENTGFSSWGTVSIRKTTEAKEIQQEEERIKQNKIETINKKIEMKKDAETRKMEEIKYISKEDSALGAYDVWSNEKGGYKGVQLYNDSNVKVYDRAKSLSEGKTSIAFKKRHVDNNKTSQFLSRKKRNKRRTTADDDD